MHFVTIMFASPAYDEMVRLRVENLYVPLGAEMDLETVAAEYNKTHWAVYDNNAKLMGTIVADDNATEDSKSILLKQVVLPSYRQKRGLGKQLMKDFENLLKDKGYTTIQVQAHKKAIPFYTKLDYQKEGKGFKEEGVSQQLLQKKL